MSKKYNIAVVGATGTVGKMMIQILLERNFPIKKLYLLASKKSEGKKLKVNGEEYLITSLDNFDFVTIKGCKGGFNVAKKSLEILLERTYPKCKILCEPQMSKRGLYPSLSIKKNAQLTKSYMDFLQYSDGTNSLEKISRLIKLDLSNVKKIYKILDRQGLFYK